MNYLSEEIDIASFSGPSSNCLAMDMSSLVLLCGGEFVHLATAIIEGVRENE